MSGLVFLGDTVWPQVNSLNIDAVLPVFDGKKLVVNLEGPILPSAVDDWRVHNQFKKNLHSDLDILNVFRRLGVQACGLANNHINDYIGSVAPTIQLLSSAGIDHFGTRVRRSAEIVSGSSRYIVIGACSRLPEPKAGRGDMLAPAILNPSEMLENIAALKQINPDAKIVCVMHWGYELMLYPEPADREWAHRAISAGADFVIGHHPHVVQGAERVGNGYIAYSLGNFLMPQGRFGGEWYGFRTPRVTTELGVEVGPAGMDFHWFRYDKGRARLEILTPDLFDGEDYLGSLSPFIGMSHVEYRHWFSSTGVRGHLTDRRAGPVYSGYFGARRFKSVGNDAYMYLKRGLRKSLMRLGLHTPKVS